MEVIKVVPRGYCKGVVRAIQIAKQCAKDYSDQRITILGMLVHNRYVMEALAQLHIHMLDDSTKTRMELLDEIESGVVIFSAHGIAPQVMEKAKKKGLICIDATCPDVRKTQEMVLAHLSQGYEVLYIGKKHHPEAEAVCAISPHVHFITPKDPLPQLSAKLFVTNQTTMSIFDIRQQLDRIQAQYPDAIISEEICNATRIRQEAVAKLAEQHIDVLYVVGDRSSNNSKRLAQIAKEHGIKSVYLIDDVNDIHPDQRINANKIAVTSGASTPTYLTNQVIHYLEHMEETIQKPKIHISALLD